MYIVPVSVTQPPRIDLCSLLALPFAVSYIIPMHIHVVGNENFELHMYVCAGQA